MSGSSSSYTPSIKSSFNCNSGSFVTNLASPDFSIVQQHSLEEVLNINIINDIVVVENSNGEILGSIIHENLQRLKDCILSGYGYHATIININEFSCRVIISNID